LIPQNAQASVPEMNNWRLTTAIIPLAGMTPSMKRDGQPASQTTILPGFIDLAILYTIYKWQSVVRSRTRVGLNAN